MKKITLFLSAAALIVLLAIVVGIPQRSSALPQWRAAATATETPSELPADAKSLVLDQSLTENLSPDTAIRFYTFTAKSGANYRLVVEPKSGDFYTTVTVMTIDLQTVVAGTVGESVISGSLIFRAPADGKYAITVVYASAQDGTPPSGQYQISLSEFRP